MLNEFLTWWAEQLMSVWPRGSTAERNDAVLATLRTDGTLYVTLRRGGKTGALGTFPATDAGMAALAAALGSRRPPAQLHLPPGLVLEHAVTLPLAAERDLARVLRYEMDRLTPFTADELHWSYGVERRDRAHAQLQARLRLVLRAEVAPVLARLRLAGLRPATVGSPGGPPIPLDTAAPHPWRRHGTTALAAACVLLAMAAAAVPFIRQSVATGRLDGQIAALRPAVDRADALRRGLAATAAGVDVLAAQRAKVGDPLEVLAALTDILPDDTVLTDLSLRQRVITISGQSGGAARLISALAADPALRDPAFTAPVTRNETTHSDGFSIRADASRR